MRFFATSVSANRNVSRETNRVDFPREQYQIEVGGQEW
jgi:hypothetical protein